MSIGQRVGSFFKRLGTKGGKLLLLIALLAASGVAIGLAASYPLQFVKFEESSAVRVDQTRLAGTVDPAQALVAPGDLPPGWAAGDPALGAFGVLGTEFCGDVVKVPTPLSDTEAAVYTNTTNDSTVISQAVRVDRWQSAREYVGEVEQALGQCEEFFRLAPGARIKVTIKEASGTPPITDYVSAAFVAEDGQSVQEWSIMAVGDVVIAIQHIGSTRPPATFLNDVEKKVLARIDPTDFAAGGVAPESTVPDDSTVTTALDSGSADETQDGAETPDATEAPDTAPPTTARK